MASNENALPVDGHSIDEKFYICKDGSIRRSPTMPSLNCYPLPPDLAEQVLVAEARHIMDEAFFRHHGFDPNEIQSLDDVKRIQARVKEIAKTEVIDDYYTNFVEDIKSTWTKGCYFTRCLWAGTAFRDELRKIVRRIVGGLFLNAMTQYKKWLGPVNSAFPYRLLWEYRFANEHEKERYTVLPEWFGKAPEDAPDAAQKDAIEVVKEAWEKATLHEGRAALIRELCNIRRALKKYQDPADGVPCAEDWQERLVRFQLLIDAADEFVSRLAPNDSSDNLSLQKTVEEYRKELPQPAASETDVKAGKGNGRKSGITTRKRGRSLTHLKDNAIKYIEEHGATASNENYKAWVAELGAKQKPGAPFVEGTDYPTFDAFRAWWSKSDRN
jgi:hypothetical protein